MVLRVVYFFIFVYVIVVYVFLVVMMRGLVYLVFVGIISWGYYVFYIFKFWGLDIRLGYVLVVMEERIG